MEIRSVRKTSPPAMVEAVAEPGPAKPMAEAWMEKCEALSCPKAPSAQTRTRSRMMLSFFMVSFSLPSDRALDGVADDHVEHEIQNFLAARALGRVAHLVDGVPHLLRDGLHVLGGAVSVLGECGRRA